MMDFKGIYDTFLGLVKLEDKTYKKVAKSSFSSSATNFAIAAIALGIGAFWTTFSITSLLSSAISGFISLVLGYFVFVGIFWVLAKIFGGKGAYMKQYNASSYLSLWNVFYVIPFIGPVVVALGSLWSIVMTVVLVRNVHGLSTGNSIAVVLIPLVIMMVLAFMFMTAFLTLIASGMVPT